MLTAEAHLQTNIAALYVKAKAVRWCLGLLHVEACTGAHVRGGHLDAGPVGWFGCLLGRWCLQQLRTGAWGAGPMSMMMRFRHVCNGHACPVHCNCVGWTCAARSACVYCCAATFQLRRGSVSGGTNSSNSACQGVAKPNWSACCLRQHRGPHATCNRGIISCAESHCHVAVCY
jgi:hypothetical protein